MKRKRLFRRILTPVLILAILISCLCVTAFADDSLTDLQLVDLSDYNDFGTRYRFSRTENTVWFDLPGFNYTRYVDFTFTGTITGLSKIEVVDPDDGSSQELEFIVIGGNVVRAYGTVRGLQGSTIGVRITVNASPYYQFNSFYVSFSDYTSFPAIGGMIVFPSNYQTEWFFMPNESTPIVLDLDDLTSSSSWNTYNQPWSAIFTCLEWQRFDFIDFCLKIDSSGIESVSAKIDGVFVPERVSFIDSSVPSIYEENDPDTSISGNPSWQWVCVRLDCRGLNRETLAALELCLTGGFFGNGAQVQLTSVTGFVDASSDNPNFFWWDKVTEFFSDLFGADDAQQEVIDNATQTQVELNQKVNVEVTNAVTNWNASVDTLSGGVNNAIAGSQVPLAWMSMLADKIFTNMGWFGNIYFTCGFLSVFLLILSKSGLVGRVKSSFQSNSPRSTGGGSKGNNTSS